MPSSSRSALSALLSGRAVNPGAAHLAADLLGNAASDASPADAAAALYVAYVSCGLRPPHPPRVPLHKFFERARAYAADASLRKRFSDAEIEEPNTAVADPRPSIAAAANAFLVSETAFRKLKDLRAITTGNVLAHFPESVGVRDVWILFLVSKVAARLDLDPALTSEVHAYHLLLAVIALLTDPQDSDFPPLKRQRPESLRSPSLSVSPPASEYSPAVDALCTATGAVPGEVSQFLEKLRTFLSHSVLSVLPLRNAHDMDELRAVSAAVEQEYKVLLDDPESRVNIDERVFVDAPHLIVPPHRDPPLAGANACQDSPRGNQILDHCNQRTSGGSGSASITQSAQAATHGITPTQVSPSPRSALSPMPVTSTTLLSPARASRPVSDAPSFVKFVHDDPRTVIRRSAGVGGDALDALAAVASSTPRSPAVQRGSSDIDVSASSTIAGASTPSLKQGMARYRRRNTASGIIGTMVAAAPPPTTPTTTGLASVKWLQELAATRPETSAVPLQSQASQASLAIGGTPSSEARPIAKDQESNIFEQSLFNRPDKDITTTACLREILKDFPGTWLEIVARVKSLCSLFSDDNVPFPSPQFLQEGCAIYFAALESVLVFESKRLGKARNRILAVIRSVAFHKSLLICALESASAAYGHRRMQVIPVAVKLFKLTPFELSKCIEPFVRRLTTLPANVQRHIAICEHRLLESIVWVPNSPLVTALHIRGQASGSSAMATSQAAAQGNGANVNVISEVVNSGHTAGDMVKCAADQSEKESTLLPSKRGREPNAVAPAKTNAAGTPRPVSVPETALELFYLKFLAIAADRMQELLILLGLEVLASDVWDVVKHCSWDKWHLMVGRHIDQIIMCSIYGMAKVRQIALTFKDIIKQYRYMSHVCEPSFQDLIPGTFCDVSLASSFPCSSEPSSTLQLETSGTESRGDIIRFYNHVFIHSTKGYLLGFQPSATIAGKDSKSSADVPSDLRRTGDALGRTPENMRNKTLIAADGGSDDSATPSTGATESLHEKSPRGIRSEGCHLSYPDSGSSKENVSQRSGDMPAVFDRVEAAVLKSPMRVSRRQLPLRRIGSITVSPMSQRGRLMASLRHSPTRRFSGGTSGTMTPATRTLYAFGESPSRNLDDANRTLRSPLPGASQSDTTPLRFDTSDPTGGIRRKQGDLLKQRGILRRTDSPR